MKNYIKSTFLFLLIGSSHLLFSQRSGNIITDPNDDIGGGGSGTTYTWYYDGDGDGLGNPYISTTTTGGTLTPIHYVANNNDCNDNDASIGLPRIWYLDADGDGYGVRDNTDFIINDPDELDPHLDPNPGGGSIPINNSTVTACSPPPGYVGNHDDCNDNNPNINIIIFFADNDGDGFGDINNSTTSAILNACVPIYGYVTNRSDCNDNDPNLHPFSTWFLDVNNDGVYDEGVDTYYTGCNPPSSNYLLLTGTSNLNWTHEINYDIQGNISNISRTYFDEIGKPNVSLSKDMMTNQTWRAETIYDNFGRPYRSSFPTVSPNSFEKIDVLSDPVAKTTYLDHYYSNNNTLHPYQATAAYPYSEIEYDQLNPGNAIRAYGGNKINDDWKTGYSFTVPAAQEMYYAFGYNYFAGDIVNNQKEIITKFYKTITVDPHGVETVTFTDGEGKVLASAKERPTSTLQYDVYSTIGTQGFVDVYIPARVSPTVITFLGGQSLYKIYNLKTGQLETAVSAGNAYRIEAITPPLTDPKTYINTVTGAIEPEANALGIKYVVRYYDYTLNYYDKSERLIKTIQPNGFDITSVNGNKVKATPNHTFATTYKYDTLGQLIETTSPDEGTSLFAYRKDGTLRFSQNALQVQQNKVSYVDYDSLGRIIESGILSGISWTTAVTAVDNPLPSGTGISRLEQNFVIYDYENNYQGITPPVNNFANLGLNPQTYTQKNLAGNVVANYNNETSSWYSYDLYGRVEWMVQNINGLGIKTIHYEYDAKGQVKKVIYQKDATTDKFEHFYTYDFNGQMTKVETSFKEGPLTTNADYDYNIDGSLKRTTIANGLQGLDYVYTLDGKLKSINHPSLSFDKDPGGDTNDVFGITLDYYTGDYSRDNTYMESAATIPGINQDNYDGNIKATRFATRSTSMDLTGTNTIQQKAYAYTYNYNKFLTNATFGNVLADNSIQTLSKYREGSLTYDANGNIKKLQRTDQNGTIIDNFTYNYFAGTNKLNYIGDLIAANTNTTDIDNQLANNFSYNAIGQLESNAQENLTYEYNASGQVTVVKKNGHEVVQFFYNERGERYKKISYKTIAPFTQNHTDYYVNDESGVTMAIYRQPHLGTIALAELPVYGEGRLGVYTVGPSVASSYYQYEITDHLGNIRAVIKEPTTSSPNTIASYADYYPFGEVLPLRNAFDNYRYSFQGQELDPETGMEAFKLRLWDGRIGRWLNPDPQGQYFSPYLGMGNNPISRIDPNGGWDYFYNQLKFYKGAGIGIGKGLYGLGKSIWYIGDTAEGIGNLGLLAVSTSGFFGGITMGGNNHYTNALIFDARFGTHTADNVEAIGTALEKFGNDLISENAETAGEAWGQLAFAVAGTKGLGNISKAKVVTNITSKVNKVVKLTNNVTKIEQAIAPIETGISIGLGIDDDLSLLRGTGAITYKNAGWQQAGLTKVDWGRSIMDNFYFKQSFKDAVQNANKIKFNVTNFDPNYIKPGITNFEFNYILSNPSLLQKTTFIQDGINVTWNGVKFIK
ncbi:RHS repeat-associated core domain-containing protein [Flavobacterium sp. 9AF]|uniref:RHS repeat domain-containing protein n=1 Tax=Flavobacterium sp. 9AF TaxID=2653142 RepID=UPI0012F177CA|nr:RHS repeat-associated core domain-containing protein [Flavobacterium sp. 9AF]VXB36351.1 RHS repeat-associated core domain-containing protein [Flavobacterium sp. 9AF]